MNDELYNFELINLYIKQRYKEDNKKEFLIRSQTQYLHSLCCAMGGQGKSPEEVLKEIENPTPVKTAEEIEKEVEEKFKQFIKKG